MHREKPLCLLLSRELSLRQKHCVSLIFNLTIYSFDPLPTQLSSSHRPYLGTRLKPLYGDFTPGHRGSLLFARIINFSHKQLVRNRPSALCC